MLHILEHRVTEEYCSVLDCFLVLNHLDLIYKYLDAYLQSSSYIQNHLLHANGIYKVNTH